MSSNNRAAAGNSDSEGPAEFNVGSLAIFEFTAEDLKANQRGYLTERQRGWLRTTARGITSCSMASAPIALGFVLLGLALTLGMYLSNEEARAALFSNPMNIVGIAAAGVIGVAAIGLSIFLAQRQASGVTKAQLRQVQGPIRLNSAYSPRSSLTTYHVYVGKHEFSFGDDMSRSFREGSEYRVYYCQSGPYQLIMSYERLA